MHKQKEAYSLWVRLHHNFPRTERLGLGRKIDSAFLDLLEWTFVGAYLPPEQKIPVLNKAMTRLDIVKFFTQISWENKLIQNEQYIALSLMLEEIGRQLGGWKKGLQTKLPNLEPGRKT